MEETAVLVLPASLSKSAGEPLFIVQVKVVKLT